MAGAHMAPCCCSSSLSMEPKYRRWELLAGARSLDSEAVEVGRRGAGSARRDSRGWREISGRLSGARILPGDKGRWSICSPSRLHPSCSGVAPFHLKLGRPHRTGYYGALFGIRGSAGPARGADASTLAEMATLADDLLKLNGVVNEGYTGIGPDMRNRVDILYNRATMLKQSADRIAGAGGRVPVQLTATLKALQREQASVENIVRLAMEAGSFTSDDKSLDELSSSMKELTTPTQRFGADDDQTSASSRALRGQTSNAPAFESLILESSLDPPEPPAKSGTQKYAMSTAAAKDSSPLAAFRMEVERRVMEQLVGARLDFESKSTSELMGEQDAGATVLIKDDSQAVSENISEKRVARGIQKRGATNEEEQPQSGSSYVREASAQMLQSMETSSSGLQSLAATAQRRLRAAASEARFNSKQLDKLRSDLSILEQQLVLSKEDSERADLAEAKVQRLTEELAGKVPLDVHEQVVRLGRESLVAAQLKIAQVTDELKEKESMLVAVKQDLLAEQGTLIEKVRDLSGELSKRVSVEEMETAVSYAVGEVEKELESVLERAESLRLELDMQAKHFAQLRNEWDMEKTSLCAELSRVKAKLKDTEEERVDEKAKLSEALQKVTVLEDSLCELQQEMSEAEQEREKREQKVLATVRSLIADMVKSRREAKSSRVDSKLLEAMEILQEGDNKQEANVEDVLGSLFSGEKAIALETFFVIMAILIKQESEKLEIIDSESDTFQNRRVGTTMNSGDAKNDHLDQNWSNKGASQGDRIIIEKPVITIYYESSWEYAYLHYSADNSEWTSLPGVCMHNGLVVNSKPLKVINVLGTSIEFVLTDGKGSWDCAPSGGNYHIRNCGTFLLSSGLIEQRR